MYTRFLVSSEDEPSLIFTLLYPGVHSSNWLKNKSKKVKPKEKLQENMFCAELKQIYSVFIK